MEQAHSPSPAGAPEPVPGDAGPYTVLVVDDDPSLLDLMEFSLRDKYHVLKALSASRALELLRANPVHLLVADQYLTGMSGAELLAVARAEKPEVGRLMVSGQSDLQDLIAAVNLGEVQHYLSKPWSPGALLAAVDSVAERLRLKDENRRLRQAEAALRQSEAAFKALIDSADEPIGSVDQRYRLVASNASFRQLLREAAGREIAEGESVVEALPPATRREWRNYFDWGLRGESFGITTATLPPRTPGVLEFHFNPTVTREGQVLGVTVWGHDITKHLEAEEALRTTLESIGDGFLACDGDWRFVYFNAAAERITGLRRADLLGRGYWEVFPLAVNTELEREYRRAALGETRDFEYFYAPWQRWLHNRCFPRKGGGLAVYFRDITERKRAEAALREGEAAFRALTENVAGGIWSVDRDYRLLACNAPFRQYYRELTGREIANGENLLDHAPESMREEWRRYFDRGLRGETLWVVTQTVPPLEPRFVELHLRPIATAEGQVLGVTIWGNDITERMQQEAALRQSEARFRLMAEHSADVIWTLDLATGRLTYVSPAVQRLRGYTPEEIIQMQDMGAAMAPDSQQRVLADLADRVRAFEAGDEAARVYVAEMDQRRKNGSVVPTEVVTTLVPDEQGRVIEIVGVSRDITARRRAEAELRMSEERYRFLVDHLPAGLLVHAADGRVILSNPKAADLLGLAPEAMQGRRAADPAWQFVHEDASPMPVEEYPAQRVFATGQLVSNQVIGIRRAPAGDFRWMLVQAFPDSDPQGRVRQAVVLLNDITRRKQTEAALRLSEAGFRELYSAAQRQAQEMALLDQVRSVVAGELDLATVMHKVVEAVSETFGYPLVSLYLRHGDVMVLQHQVGYRDVIPEIPISKGVLGKVMRSGQPLLLGDAHADPDFLEAAPGVRSEACVPLFDGDQSVGALNVETLDTVLADADLRLLTALAEHIGLAIGRARLYTQVREDASTRAILLHEVNHRVKNNLTAIIGLLQLQQDHLPLEMRAIFRPVFDDLTGRIHSLAAVHDMLSTAAWAPLAVHDLAGRIIHAVVKSASPTAGVAVDIAPSAVQVTAKMAGPLALIMNELATNSLKYALPRTPALRLSLDIRQHDSQVEVEYRDNGPGFPPEVLRGKRQNVGLHLIQLLSRHDLRGKMELSNEGGAVFRLWFAATSREAMARTPTGPLSISGSPE